MNEPLFYHTAYPHSDLSIEVRHLSPNIISVLGLTASPMLEYEVTDSAGQTLVYQCLFGSRNLMTLSERTLLSEDEAHAVSFIREAHVAMLALGFEGVATDDGDEVSFEAFGIELEDVTSAIAASNHLGALS